MLTEKDFLKKSKLSCIRSCPTVEAFKALLKVCNLKEYFLSLPSFFSL